MITLNTIGLTFSKTRSHPGRFPTNFEFSEHFFLKSFDQIALDRIHLLCKNASPKSFQKFTKNLRHNSLDTSKSTQSKDIPFKIIKDNADIFANFILQNFKKCTIDRKFPDQLKKADVSLVLKKEAIMIK